VAVIVVLAAAAYWYEQKYGEEGPFPSQHQSLERMQDAGCKMQDTGKKMQMLDTRCGKEDAGGWMGNEMLDEEMT